jgi:hypothetical protein
MSIGEVNIILFNQWTNGTDFMTDVTNPTETAETTVQTETLDALPEKVQRLIENLRRENGDLKRGKTADAPVPVIPAEIATELAALRKAELERQNTEAKASGDVEKLLTNLRAEYEPQVVNLGAKADAAAKQSERLAVEMATLKVAHEKDLLAERSKLTDYRLENQAFQGFVNAKPASGEGIDSGELFAALYPQIKKSIQSVDGKIAIVDAEGNPKLNAEGKPMSLSAFYDGLRSSSMGVFFAPPPQSTGSGKAPTGAPPTPANTKLTIPRATLQSQKAQIAWAQSQNIGLAEISKGIASGQITII